MPFSFDCTFPTDSHELRRMWPRPSAAKGRSIYDKKDSGDHFCHYRQIRTSERNQGESSKPGRPRTTEEIRELIAHMAQENAWGYSRIHGELKKVGITEISRSTV